MLNNRGPNLAVSIFYFYRMFGGTLSRREITAIASCDAVCISLLPRANRMSPMAIPTKNTTTNATLIMLAVPWRTRTNSPQLLVQKLLVTLIHLPPSGNGPYETRGNWPVFRVLLRRVRSPVYQFGEAATNLIIEDLFYAVRVHAFILHQRLELVFQ